MCDRKLLEGDKVEVRLSDEGLKGSWHQGTIVGTGGLKRFVEYDEFDADDGLSKLIECITVSLPVEGLTNQIPRNYRGNIRPVPPCQAVDRLEIRYGMCVDALLNHAWWEGVVFDRAESSLERLIFFPDQGDQHLIPIDRLRPTLDWNEVSQEWKIRDDWIMLKLLNKLGEEEPLPISIRQIWYDISCLDIFHQNIGEWTFGSQSEWHSLLLEVITEAFSVAQGQHMMQIVPVSESISTPLTSDAPEVTAMDLGSPKGFQENDVWLSNEYGDSVATGMQNCFASDYSEIIPGVIIDHSSEVQKHACSIEIEEERILRDDLPECFKNKKSVEQEQSMVLDFIAEQCNSSLPQFHEEKEIRKDMRDDAKSHSISLLDKCYQGWGNVEHWAGVIDNNFLTTGNQYSDSLNETTSQNKKVRGKYHKANPWEDANMPARYDPEAIVNLELVVNQNKFWPNIPGNTDVSHVDLWANARKHLVALGWRIYHKSDGFERKTKRYLYCSPDGLKFYSLKNVYWYLIKSVPHQLGDSDHPHEDCSKSELLGKNVLVETSEEVSGSNIIVPENCPEAIVDYVSYMEEKYRKRRTKISKVEKRKRLKAKKHLSYLGWTFPFREKNGSYELCYRSPDHGQKIFISLLRACRTLLGKKEYTEGFAATVVGTTDKATYKCKSDEHNQKSSTKFDRSDGFNFVTLWDSRRLSDSREIKQLDGRSVNDAVHFLIGTQVEKHRDKRLCRKITEHSICIEDFHNVEFSPMSVCNSGNQQNKNRQPSRVSRKCVPDSCSSRRKRAQDVSPLSPVQHVPRTILSWLIDNNVVLPRQKVKYICKEDGHVMMEGRITRNGISCSCCKKVYTLADFEIHAGSNFYRPAANIFLHDGRSLWDCQRQTISNRRVRQLPHRRTKGNNSIYPSDSICSICQDGGDLILCDSCPSSFHLTCIGLEDVPEGDWFCPSCHCSICGFSEFNDIGEKFSEETILFCDQCEREFHVGCVSLFGSESLTCCPEGSWFCSTSCSKIFWHLRGLLGKRNTTSVEGISWTLLRPQENDFVTDTFAKESWIEYHSKLYIALDVLHECFVSLIEPRTSTDLVEDLLFNTESELRRLNFWGFYTMLLEKGDELISVATFRVFGDKVAEMPFVGTRIQYRRRGMCRVLMDELEKLLNSMGVQRLLLPAVPQLLPTWKGSFGFLEMTHSDVLMLSKYTFLSFQGTTMCQKFLKTVVSISDESNGYVNQLRESITTSSSNMGCFCSSTTSEVVEKMHLEFPPAAAKTVIVYSDDVRNSNSGCHFSPASAPSGMLCLQESKSTCL